MILGSGKGIVRSEDRIARIAGSALLVLVLYLLKAILIPFLVAAGLACVLNPPVDRLARWLGWPRGMTVASFAIEVVLIAIAGALLTVGLMALGMPHALVLGVASGIVEAVPYLGPLAAGSVAALIALPQGTSLILKVAALYITIRLLIDLVIGPRVLGRVLHLHPLAVLFALLVGGHVLGIAGFFIAPLVAAVAAPAVD